MEEYQARWAKYAGCCHVCLEPPKGTRPLFIDHEHVRGWKSMTKEGRKRFVRGLACNYCNRRRIGKGMNLEIAKSIVKYLTDYAAEQIQE